MRQRGQSSLYEALADWGAHEALGRFREQISVDPGDKAACVDFILRARAPLIAHILSHHPSGAVCVEFEPADASVIRLFNGMTINEWIASANADARDHVNILLGAADPPKDPLVAAQLIHGGPIVLYDGCHRAAAWHQRNCDGQASNISAHVIAWTLP